MHRGCGVVIFPIIVFFSEIDDNMASLFLL